MALDKVQFSLPLWPGLSPEEIERDVYPFLEECGDLIADLYYTSRMAPFHKDAMGGILIAGEDQVVTRNAMVISERFGIPLSATFNNTHVSPAYENYQTFVKNFRKLYEAGIHVVTIPHTSWLGFGLKKEFPELIVKNTILHKVYSPAEGAMLFQAGFDYINLDRNLMRDERSLREWGVMKAALMHDLGRPLYLSLLYNEHCEAHCPVQNDHYAYNLHRTKDTKAYFDSEMASVSPCKSGREHGVLWNLKSATIPSYYSYLDHLSDYVDCFKMHGRESKFTFYESMKIIRQFKQRVLIDDSFRIHFQELDMDTEIRPWLKKIRTCRFNCWRCNACDELAALSQSRNPHGTTVVSE